MLRREPTGDTLYHAYAKSVELGREFYEQDGGHVAYLYIELLGSADGL